ncbi:MAG: cytochrome c oxidase assembly protein [Gemmatimonadales bacterium]
MSWWCAALDEPWSWTWRAYPGIWLFVLAIGAAYVFTHRHATERTTAREWTLFGLGLLALWVAADWPLGTLASGYLLTARILQYILLVLVAPPLLLSGTPRWMLRRLTRGPRAERVARYLTRPLVPLLVYNVVMVVAHLPTVIDGPARSALGTFVLDMLMIVSGLIFWWPALGRLPELKPMTYPGRIGYLLLSVFLPTVPASFFTFSRYPIYGLYELAPPVLGIGAIDDQRVAGLLMKTGGGLILFGTMSVMFFRWYAKEEGA